MHKKETRGRPRKKGPKKKTFGVALYLEDKEIVVEKYGGLSRFVELMIDFHIRGRKDSQNKEIENAEMQRLLS